MDTGIDQHCDCAVEHSQIADHIRQAQRAGVGWGRDRAHDKASRENKEHNMQNDLQHLQEIIDIENSIDQEERDLQQKHVERLTRNECTPEAGMIFSDLVSGLERVADHATNIAFSILDEDPEEKAAREAVAGAER